MSRRVARGAARDRRDGLRRDGGRAACAPASHRPGVGRDDSRRARCRPHPAARPRHDDGVQRLSPRRSHALRLAARDPIDGAITNILCSGLSREDRAALADQPSLTPEKRRLAFSDEYPSRRGLLHPARPSAVGTQLGITGTMEMADWHPDDMLFIPLRGTAGIVGTISVDDPIDQSAPTLAVIEPIARLANFAALAIERVVKLGRAADAERSPARTVAVRQSGCAPPVRRRAVRCDGPADLRRPGLRLRLALAARR